MSEKIIRTHRKHVLEIGRHRFALTFGRRLRRYRWGVRKDAPGAYAVSFGFGVVTYLRRWKTTRA